MYSKNYTIAPNKTFKRDRAMPAVYKTDKTEVNEGAVVESIYL